MKLKVRLALFAAVLSSMAWGFWLMFSAHAVWAFTAVEEDLSYGWYVPVFSLYVVWRERKRLGAYCREGDALTHPLAWAAALAMFVVCAFMGFIGIRGAQLRFEIVGFAGMLWSLVLMFWGWRTARTMVFPCAFLLFCLPLNSFLDVITVHLRLFATGTAFAILKGLGADIVRQGTMLAGATGNFAIDVAAPCSGLRSIFALMALTAAYGYFTQRDWLRWALLFACSVPLAILGNICRILSIVATANWCSADFATGFYHDYSGYVVFLVAVGSMVGVSGLVSRIPWRLGSISGDEPEAVAAGREISWRQLAVLAAVSVATIALMAFQAQESNPVLAEAPEIALVGIDGFAVESVPPSESEIETLPKDTIIRKAQYVNWHTGDWHLVTCVIGGTSKGSIHRPELCLPSQGFQMVRPRNRRIAGREWHVLDIERGYALPMGFAYTFFNQEGYSTASHVKRIFRDVLDRSIRNRYDRWVMVTVNSSSADEATQAEFISRLEAIVWKK